MYNMPELFLLGSALKKGIYENAKKRVSCYDICNIQYTSGTTGFPKGVMLTHYGITNNAYCIGERMRYSDHTVLCIPVPLFHCFGIVLGLICMIVYGGICVIIETFDAFAVLSSIHKEKCTSIYGVPTMYLAELNHPLFKKFNMSSLRTGVMAGSVCPQWLMEEVMDKMYMKDITICYGLTEVSPVMTQTDADDTVEVKVTTVGHELPHIEVKVLDPETLEECAVGEEGEMCCRGYNIMKGYYKDPEATNLMIDKNGFLHSGDLGTKGIDGNYRITGRIKDMIIRGGENIYPAEIEAYLYNMPEIEAVEVIAVPSRKYGEEVGAFIILKKDKYLEADDIKNFCKGNISRYKIPKYIFFVDQYPLTASGKIQKYKLRDLAVDMLQKEGVALD